MSGHIEKMRSKIGRTKDLSSVVHTMKAMAASKIHQYEEAVQALNTYHHAILQGLSVCLKQQERMELWVKRSFNSLPHNIIVFGSDLGLIGRFNEKLFTIVQAHLASLSAKRNIYVVGERMSGLFSLHNDEVNYLYRLPQTIRSITFLIGELILRQEEGSLYVFYNRPEKGSLFEPVKVRVLPLDDAWIKEVKAHQWSTYKIPQILGNAEETLGALVKEYLFVSLFKACTESLTAENASRLAAMYRAEKNIEEILSELQQDYYRIRQQTIDEELFDIITAFNFMKFT